MFTLTDSTEERFEIARREIQNLQVELEKTRYVLREIIYSLSTENQEHVYQALVFRPDIQKWLMKEVEEECGGC